MPGELDPLYVKARRILLDALEALGAHADATVLIGAQALYLQVGEADLPLAPFTSDGDLALNPRVLGPDPKLESAMGRAGFTLDEHEPGIWRKPVKDDVGTVIEMDLMVPEALGGPGKRGARLGEHGRRAARKGRGLEAAVVDNDYKIVAALEDSDFRQFRTRVASPAALLVAKLHKLADRDKDKPGRQNDKDALDAYRLLRLPRNALAEALSRIGTNELAAGVTREAMGYLEELFGAPESAGSQMAVRALEGVVDPRTVALSCSVLAREILASLAT
ncbi:MAG: hypothetical protein ACYDAG_08160 [Chloroflexota bacterium]